MVDTDAKKVSAVRHHAHSLFFDKVFSCLPATACKNGNDCQGYGRQAKTMSIITATLSLLYDVSCRDMQTKIEMSVLQTTVICSQSNAMCRTARCTLPDNKVQLSDRLIPCKGR